MNDNKETAMNDNKENEPVTAEIYGKELSALLKKAIDTDTAAVFRETLRNLLFFIDTKDWFPIRAKDVYERAKAKNFTFPPDEPGKPFTIKIKYRNSKKIGPVQPVQTVTREFETIENSWSWIVATYAKQIYAHDKGTKIPILKSDHYAEIAELAYYEQGGPPTLWFSHSFNHSKNEYLIFLDLVNATMSTALIPFRIEYGDANNEILEDVQTGEPKIMIKGGGRWVEL